MVLVVSIKVRPEKIDEFMRVTSMNAAESRKEAGISRFDLLQDKEDPSHFLLVEGYRSPEAQAAHRETRHYLLWKSAAEPLLAEPRTRSTYEEIVIS